MNVLINIFISLNLISFSLSDMSFIDKTYLRNKYNIPPNPVLRPEGGKCNNYNLKLNNATNKWIVMHYTVGNFNETVATFINDKSYVSSNYVISGEGVVYRFVPDKYRSWHAGMGKFKHNSILYPEFLNLNENADILENDMNSWSIGIEHVNSGKEPFTEPQIKSSIKLVKMLIAKFQIDPIFIIGHSDWSPTRKIDPGIYFPWDKFFKENLGLYSSVRRKENPIVLISYNDKTKQNKNDISRVQRLLERLGYFIVKDDGSNIGILDNDTVSAMLAFNMHYTGDLLRHSSDWEKLWTNSNDMTAKGVLAQWTENSENVLNDLLKNKC